MYTNKWWMDGLLSLSKCKNIFVIIEPNQHPDYYLGKFWDKDSELITNFDDILKILFTYNDIRSLYCGSLEWFYYETIFNYMKESTTLFSIEFILTIEEILVNLLNILKSIKWITSIKFHIMDYSLSSDTLSSIEAYVKEHSSKQIEVYINKVLKYST